MSAASAVMNVSPAHRLKLGIAANFCFAECETRISELDALVEDCDALGIDLAELAAPLDAAVSAAEDTGEPQAKRQRSTPDALPGEKPSVLDVSAHEPHAASLLLTYAARYLSVIGQPGLALGHFRAALIIKPPSVAPPSVGPSTPQLDSCAAEAQLGMAQSALALGHREQAAMFALHFWRSSHSRAQLAGSYAAARGGLCIHSSEERAHMHLAFLLAALAGTFPPPSDSLVLLRRLSPLLSTPAL